MVNADAAGTEGAAIPTLGPDTLGALLEAQAAARPDAVALLAPGREPLTYAELLGQVRATVEALNAFGIGRGDRVAVVLPNGPEMAAAFLGVAAGTACAPLNPADRAEELQFTLGDLRIDALVVSAGSDSPAVPAARDGGIPVVELVTRPGDRAGAFTLRGAARPRPAADGWAAADDLVLVLHTSGTTARPKIVPLTQRNILRSAGHTRLSLELTERDRCLQVMPLFHIHGLIGALLSSLVAGGSVVCTPGFAVDHFADWLASFQPTWYSAVPTMHQAVLESVHRQGAGSAPGALRFIRSGSAALAPTVANGLEQAFGAPVIENYGMTEAAHQMASNPLPPRPHKLGSVGVPAGPEIAIMDDAGGLLAAGSAGEIVIRGDNVMQGYENNPAANATAFTNGWFRTGDQGYFDPDGYLYLTSRIKEIINRGGEKIAPVEVDGVLLQHPAVAEAVTFAVPHPTLGEDVAAAVVLRPGATTSVRELRGFVGAHLAAFKVPGRILVLDELPKGPTGKLQRIGLAERLGLTGHHETTEATAATEARSPLEEALARIWAEVLRLDHVGVHDNFLELGGDSIEATLIASRAHDELGLDIPLDVLLGESTIAEQAQAIETHGGTALPPIRRRGGAGTAPLSYGQERLWLGSQEADGALVGIRPQYLRLSGPLDAAVLERVLNQIVHRHEVLRTTYATVDGAPVQVIAPALAVRVPLLDLSSRPAADQQAELQRLTAEDFRQPFDLAQGPVLRARLLRFSATDHVLLLTFHHIAFDGWSAGVLVRELAALYDAFARRKRSPLPALPVQYADYAVWQHNLMATHALDAEEAYWKEALGGSLPPPAVPTDRAGPAGPDARDADRTWVLPRELTDDLKALSRREGVTLFMMLLGAFNVLLQRLTGQESIVIRAPIAGRTHAELEGLIGFFMNMLALRTDLAGDPSFRELLARVRRETLGAYTHQDVPFLALIRDLAPRLDLSRKDQLSDPAFQLRNVGQRTARAADLEISQLDVEIDAPKMDLYLELEETADGLSCLWVYRTDLFERAAVEAMMARFRALLTAVVADPSAPLSALPF